MKSFRDKPQLEPILIPQFSLPSEVEQRPTRLLQTREAFDALSRDYDGSEQTNTLLQRLRHQMWDTLTGCFPRHASLLDLGCGTGIDAAYLAEQGYRILATDLSPQMTARTRKLADQAGVGAAVEARPLAIENLATLEGEHFDGIYSNRGPLNCVDNIEDAARNCARLLQPGGLFVATVIGRICPWEILYYASHREWDRAVFRMRRGFVSVPLQGQEVPTRYFTPRELYAPFSPYFELAHCRSLGLFLPPTYLASLSHRHPHLSVAAARFEDCIGSLPIIRGAGDLFLIVLRRRGRSQG